MMSNTEVLEEIHMHVPVHKTQSLHIKIYVVPHVCMYDACTVYVRQKECKKRAAAALIIAAYRVLCLFLCVCCNS